MSGRRGAGCLPRGGRLRIRLPHSLWGGAGILPLRTPERGGGEWGCLQLAAGEAVSTHRLGAGRLARGEVGGPGLIASIAPLPRRPGESGGARWLVLQRDSGAASALSRGRGLDLEGKSDGAGRNRCTEYGASLLRKKCFFWCGPDRSEIQRLAGKCGASLRESSLSINSNE